MKRSKYPQGAIVETSCRACPKDELKREKEKLIKIKNAVTGFEALQGIHLETVGYKDCYAIYGELIIRHNDCKGRIKRLKAEIKAG